ncbi:PREDICTED: UPF0725 protein At4g29550-like [Camelina sativa]|uniref:UPF0725 protein At4g29550-like n=1 Tax=Camelina sativa TaxID=90675 RepID=A0ABM1QHY9_CAMSA|nr:PREDICTED: UPF0725 protein At4g29550-like [Camelina sativa]
MSSVFECPRPYGISVSGIMFNKEGDPYRVNPITGKPYFVDPSLLPPGELRKLLGLPPSDDDDYVDDVDYTLPPIIEPFTIPDFPVPSGPPLESLRYPIYEKITPRHLLGKVGLHCYNLQKGTNFQYLCGSGSIHKDTGIFTSLLRNSNSQLESRVLYNEVEEKRCSTMITTLCRLKPPEEEEEVERDLCAAFDRLAVDDFFKGDISDWVPDGATDNLQYYEMKESDVEEHKQWLHLYAELAFFTTLDRFLDELRWAQPFELRKIIVQTREYVEPKKKAKAENAIFYISFKTRGGGENYNAIIRRTMDGTPDHMSLEVKCFKM